MRDEVKLRQGKMHKSSELADIEQSHNGFKC